MNHSHLVLNILEKKRKEKEKYLRFTWILSLPQVSSLCSRLPDLLRGQGGDGVHHLSAEPPWAHVTGAGLQAGFTAASLSNRLLSLEGERGSRSRGAQCKESKHNHWHFLLLMMFFNYYYQWHFRKEPVCILSFKSNYIWLCLYFFAKGSRTSFLSLVQGSQIINEMILNKLHFITL